VKLLVLAGPTAVGKTAAAVHVACVWKARLISADAMQVYRGMDIGTGKAPVSVLNRYPHAGVDIREPHQEFNAVDFAEMADEVITGSWAEGVPVVVVGGTAFYLRALLSGLVDAPSGDPALREELERLPDPHRALEAVDPVTAARLHPHDRVRVIRALEVYRLSGQPLSEFHAQHAPEPRYPAICLWLDRDDLDARIDARVLRMVSRGYVGEVRALVEAGARETRPMQSLGYRHMAAHLDGLALEEAIRLTQRDTRKYARRQRGMIRSLGGFKSTDAREREEVLAAALEAFGEPPRGWPAPPRTG
jgi:tRNA dimethylallyltransferase